MSVERCQNETTSTQFLKWIWYMDWEDIHGFHREDYFYAQIAAEVRRTISKNPKQVKLEQLLLKFTTKTEVMSQRTKQFMMKQSKAKWNFIANVGSRKDIRKNE